MVLEQIQTKLPVLCPGKREYVAQVSGGASLHLQTTKV